jgi:hypothetical protein
MNRFFEGRIIGRGDKCHIPGRGGYGYITVILGGYDDETRKYLVADRDGTVYSVSVTDIVVSFLYLEAEEMDYEAIRMS